jgi:hypothetical protein
MNKFKKLHNYIYIPVILYMECIVLGGIADAWMDGWLAGWMDGSLGGWMDGWIDGLFV